MDLTNFNIFYILFLILAHSWKIVLAESEKSQIEQSTQRYGVWINKGLEYSRCFSSAIERQRCANFSLIQRPMNKNRVLRPDCAFLMHRLACSLYKLNCPTQTDSSFQVCPFVALILSGILSFCICAQVNMLQIETVIHGHRPIHFNHAMPPI